MDSFLTMLTYYYAHTHLRIMMCKRKTPSVRDLYAKSAIVVASPVYSLLVLIQFDNLCIYPVIAKLPTKPTDLHRINVLKERTAL